MVSLTPVENGHIFFLELQACLPLKAYLSCRNLFVNATGLRQALEMHVYTTRTAIFAN